MSRCFIWTTHMFSPHHRACGPACSHIYRLIILRMREMRTFALRTTSSHVMCVVELRPLLHRQHAQKRTYSVHPHTATRRQTSKYMKSIRNTAPRIVAFACTAQRGARCVGNEDDNARCVGNEGHDVSATKTPMHDVLDRFISAHE